MTLGGGVELSSSRENSRRRFERRVGQLEMWRETYVVAFFAFLIEKFFNLCILPPPSFRSTREYLVCKPEGYWRQLALLNSDSSSYAGDVYYIKSLDFLPMPNDRCQHSPSAERRGTTNHRQS